MRRAFAALFILGVSPLAFAQTDGGIVIPTDPAKTWARVLAADTTAREYSEELLEDGRHQRFGTESKGPRHVWRASAYRHESAGIVVYIHGFYTNVDQAFHEHRLAEQFRDSGRNAVFIVPEAPSWRTDGVFWDSLDDLLTQVAARTGARLPSGPVTVIGHSGAYRTMVNWLPHPRFRQLILVDGLYANDAEFQEWLAMRGHPRQMVMVGFETAARSEWFIKRYPKAVKLDEFPYLYDRLPPSTVQASVIYIQTERFDHMQLVTDGRVLPALLHLAP